METKVFTYAADLEWIGDRRSVVRAGGRPEIVVAPPVDFPSGKAGEWSPEHLFLGSLQSCTMLSFVAHCAHRGLEIVSYESHAEGTLQRREEDHRYAFTAVDQTVQVKMAWTCDGRACDHRSGRARLLHLRLDHRRGPHQLARARIARE